MKALVVQWLRISPFQGEEGVSITPQGINGIK